MKTNYNQNKQKYFLSLVKKLLAPAYGCTEIGTVALATSIASEHLKNKIKHINISVSSYIFRNVECVGVPFLGEAGTKAIAIAGSLIKSSHDKLGIISKLTRKQADESIKLAKTNFIELTVEKHSNPLYVRALLTDVNDNTCEVIIENGHTSVKRIKLNNKIVKVPEQFIRNKENVIKFSHNEITLQEILEYSSHFKLDDISFLQKGLDINEKVLNYGLTDLKDHPYIKSILQSYTTFTNSNWKNEIILNVATAVVARMNGCPLPVMASSGSGDHGLTVNLPIYTYGKIYNIDKLKVYQAMCAANLITHVIKKSIGSLSAYCGSVVAAATASMCGLGFLRDYSIEQINTLINLCLSSFAGSLCDGAKVGCAWKIQSAIITGLSAMDIVEQKQHINVMGITNKDAFETINGLGNISNAIMDTTNIEVIDVIKKNVG